MATAQRKTRKGADRRTPRKLARQKFAGAIYRANEQTLFVPNHAMRRVRAAASRGAILERSEVKRSTWDRWQRTLGANHWLFDWLYWEGEAPSGIVHVSTQRLRKQFSKGEFCLEPEMASFRRQSSIPALARAANVHRGTIDNWLARYEEPWFRSWLLRAATPPGIHVARESDAEACRRAWDYLAIAADVSAGSAYYLWLKDSLPRENWTAWVGWLFGGPAPEGWCIVTPELAELRFRLSPRGICRAAGVPFATYHQWDAKQRRALAEICEGRGKAEAWQECFPERDLPAAAQASIARSKDQMRAYARHSSLASAFDDVTMNASDWMKCLRDAKRVGGESLRHTLRKFVLSDHRRQFEPHAIGTLERFPRLFLASARLIRFRGRAIERATEEKISQVRGRIPPTLLQLWFLDWAVPGELRDQEGIQATTPSAANANGHAPTKEQVGRQVDEPLSPLFTCDLTEIHVDVRDVLLALLNRRSGESKNRAAVQALGGNKKRAASCLRQILRYQEKGTLKANV